MGVNFLPWNKFKYVVFDTPQPELRHLSYRERYFILRDKSGMNQNREGGKEEGGAREKRR